MHLYLGVPINFWTDCFCNRNVVGVSFSYSMLVLFAQVDVMLV